jgi:hypothetical protein
MRATAPSDQLQTMRPLPLLAFLGLMAAAAGCARAAELNAAPIWVGQTAGEPAARVESWTAAGPLFFSKPVLSPLPGGPVRASGLRPLFMRQTDPTGDVRDVHVAYPIFSYHAVPDGYRWSIFNIVNHSVARSTPSSAANQQFDLWPFYFSRASANPDNSYHAFFPVYGEMKTRFGQDRLRWILFPLYVQAEKNGVTNTIAPWPFVRVMKGGGNHGLTVWPLFGRQEKEGAYRKQFYLWPFGYKTESELWEPQPTVRWGVFPFYMSEDSRAVTSESYAFFFGYTDRRGPYRYQEKRYFWPLFVQGRGDDRLINRWGPFYTHSVVKGIEKTWIMWPLWRHVTYVDGGLRHTKRQFAYFLFYENEQRSAKNDALPVARKSHYWPLASVWDNGAGRRQLQALSPLEVFFPNNEVVRELWSPLFAVYRYDRAPERVRHSVLWNFVSYRRDNEQKAFHLGPLFSLQTARAEGTRRYAIGSGLFGVERHAQRGWRFFAFEFRKRPRAAAVARDPGKSP